MKRFTYAGLLFLSTSCGVGSPGTEGGTTTAGPCNCTVENGLDAGQANPDSGAAEVDAGLTPDGGNPDSGLPPPALASGTRLKIIYWTSPDGLRVPKYTNRFWDVEKQVRCELTSGAVSPVRCFPVSEATTSNWQAFYYEDSSCTTKMVQNTQGVLTYIVWFNQTGADFVNLAGDLTTPSTYYTIENNQCVATTNQTNMAFRRFGADVTTQFAQVTETIDP